MSAPEKDGNKELQRLLSQEESEILRQELARFLREEFSPRQLLEPLRDELLSMVNELVRREVKEELFRKTDRLRKELREEVRSLVEAREDSRPPIENEAPRRSLLKRRAARNPDRLRKLVERGGTILLGVIALMVVGLYGFQFAQQRGFFSSQKTPAPSVASAFPTTAKERAQLPTTWVDLMDPVQTALPAGGALRSRLDKQSLSERFFCSFPLETQAKLEAHLASDMAPEAFRKAVREAFPSCALQDAAPLQGSPAVLSAQAAVKKILTAKVGSGWKEWCPSEKEPSAAALKSFRLDGIPGVPTFTNIDLYLQCKGQAGRSLDSKSEATDYLAVLYLALQDLRREPREP